MLNYIKIVTSMSASLGVAEAESHHFLTINNQPAQITFRYYSPPRCQQSQTSNISNKRERSGAAKSRGYESNESSIEQELTIIRQNITEKVPHAPEKYSDKFYTSKMQEIKFLTLDAYEQLHKKLLRHNLPQSQNKTIKLSLISPSAEKSLQKKPNSNILTQSYIKRVQINLKPANQIKRKQDEYLRPRSAEKSQKGHRNIAIRLYEPNRSNQKNSSLSKNSNCNSYITPRKKSCSHKKGITVYSTSTRKQSAPDEDHYHFFKTENNVSANHASSQPHQIQEKPQQAHATTSASVSKSQNIFLSNRKHKKSLKEKYGEQFVEQLKKKTQITRKRVYSKSRLGSKQKPIKRAMSKRKIKL